METPIEILKNELRQMNAVISLRRHSKKREYIKLVPLFEEAIRVLESQQNTKTELPNNCNIPVVSNSVVCHNVKKYLCEGNDNEKYCKGCLDYY